jgi:sulfoxide reductase heme-binding subunit YedZ
MKRFFIYLIAFLPIVYLLIRLFIIDDVNDPIKYIYTITGVSATVILFVSILISLIKEKINLMKYRKEIGLLGFFYAFLHLLNFIVFDASFDFEFILKESFEKPFIYLGMIAFCPIIQ